jgi:hypothetical protein
MLGLAVFALCVFLVVDPLYILRQHMVVQPGDTMQLLILDDETRLSRSGAQYATCQALLYTKEMWDGQLLAPASVVLGSKGTAIVPRSSITYPMRVLLETSAINRRVLCSRTPISLLDTMSGGPGLSYSTNHISAPHTSGDYRLLLICDIGNVENNLDKTYSAVRPFSVFGAEALVCGSQKYTCKSGTVYRLSDTSTAYRWECRSNTGGQSILCTESKTAPPACGDGVCDVKAGEDCEICPKDCRACVICNNNGVCENNAYIKETSENCADCRPKEDVCADGLCRDICLQNCEPDDICADGLCRDECPQNCVDCSDGACKLGCPQNCLEPGCSNVCEAGMVQQPYPDCSCRMKQEPVEDYTCESTGNYLYSPATHACEPSSARLPSYDTQTISGKYSTVMECCSVEPKEKTEFDASVFLWVGGGLLVLIILLVVLKRMRRRRYIRY